MEKIIRCASCGAEFDENAPKCPYCGSLNIKGAEKEYLEKLEDVRENLEELGELPGEELKSSVRRQAGRFRKLAVVLVIFVIAAIGFMIALSRSSDEDLREEYVWKAENFPKLDAVYETGEYEELLDLFEQLRGENSSVYSWSHYEFVSDLMAARDLKKDLDTYGEDADEYALTNIFYNQWKMKGILEHQKDYKDTEWEALEPVIMISEEHFDRIWHLTDGQIEELMKEFRRNERRYVSFGTCEKFVKEWLKEKQ